MTRRRRRQRGTTLTEILISLAVVLIGMLALFRTLGTAVTGSMTASRFSQAQQRAVLVMESIRSTADEGLSCLAATAATSWSNCEQTCRTALATNTLGPTGPASADSCIYVTLTPTASGTTPQLAAQADANLQKYYVVTSTSSGKPISQVTTTGSDNRIIEIQVVVGWRDDNTVVGDPDHSVVLRSGVFE